MSSSTATAAAVGAVKSGSRGLHLGASQLIGSHLDLWSPPHWQLFSGKIFSPRSMVVGLIITVRSKNSSLEPQLAL